MELESEADLLFRGQLRLCDVRKRIAIRTFVLVPLALFGSWSSLLFAADVTATRLDGTAIRGELRTWNDAQVVVSTPSGNESIATDQLVSLRWPAPLAAEKPPAGAPGLAELTDGSLLPIETLLVTGDKATLKLPATVGESAALPLSVKSLAVVRFLPFDDVLTKQWEEIRQSKPAGDLLVVRKRDGKSLDYVEGVLGEITADKVELKVDGESNRADRAKVAGVFYLRTPHSATGEPRVLLQGRSGLRAAARDIEIVAQDIVVTTPGGTKFNWPIVDLELADFSRGKITYLSDMDAVPSDWTPLVGLPPGFSTVAAYGQVRRDQSAFGGPLTLRVPDSADAETPTRSERAFNKGLAIRSRTELVFRLPGDVSRFTALAGIEPATTVTGNLNLEVFADDRLLLETEVSGTQPPVPIDVQVRGAKRLKIVVDYGKNLDTGDWLNLCDAKLVK